MALLKITDASGRQWQYSFLPGAACTIGRAPDNAVVIDDPRASRYHAHISLQTKARTRLSDGALINGQLRRSANKVSSMASLVITSTKEGDRVRLAPARCALNKP